jgi:hypothetical protein
MGERWYPAVIVAAVLAAMFYALHAHLSPPFEPTAQTTPAHQTARERPTLSDQAAENKTIFTGITLLDVADVGPRRLYRWSLDRDRTKR